MIADGFRVIEGMEPHHLVITNGHWGGEETSETHSGSMKKDGLRQILFN